MLELYGTENGCMVSRKHIGWYVSGLHGAAEFRHRVNSCKDTGQVKEMIREFYESILEHEKKTPLH